MALVIATIEAQIEALLNTTSNLELPQAKEKFKKDLAAIIVNAIKSATITIPSGAIQTVGSATAQANAVPVVVSQGLS